MFLSSVALSCDCLGLGELSKNDIDKADYIALVKIKEILSLKADSTFPFKQENFFKAIIEESSLYKGTHVAEIIVAGGNFKFQTWTSCDFGMNENEEWVIFGRYIKGKVFIYPCGRTIKYRQVDGFRDWQTQFGIRELNFLDEYFKKSGSSNQRKNGELKYFFPNGNIEKIEHYKRGKLQGDIEYYFPDGKLYGKGNYHKSKLDKIFTWYFRSGNIEQVTTYSNGIKIDTSVYYTQIKGHYPIVIYVYNKKGELLLFQEFTALEHYLRNETIYDIENKKEKIIFYYPNGKIQTIGYRINKKDWGEYIEYDELGNIIRKWKYDENGKVIP